MVSDIEALFDLTFEYTSYARVVRRDISNYMAVGTDGRVKAIGDYGYDLTNLAKKGNDRIIIQAVQAYFLRDTPIAITIAAAIRLTDFIDHFKATPGWHLSADGGEPRKIARWYNSTSGVLLRKIHQDGRSEIVGGGGCLTIVDDLPAEFPDNIDHSYYVKRAQILVDGIENPKISKKSTLAIAEMDKEQRKLFKLNHATITADRKTVDAVDLTAIRAQYAAASSGKFDLMSALMVRVWITGNGRLTRGDLLALAWKIDEGEDYFKGKKARNLAAKAEWVARSITPFLRPLNDLEIAQDALVWAEASVEKLQRPKPLHHSNFVRSTLVPEGSKRKWMVGADRPKLACAIAANARKHGFNLSETMLADILKQAREVSLRRMESECPAEELATAGGIKVI